jgi:hypothetical protein
MRNRSFVVWCGEDGRGGGCHALVGECISELKTFRIGVGFREFHEGRLRKCLIDAQRDLRGDGRLFKRSEFDEQRLDCVRRGSA